LADLTAFQLTCFGRHLSRELSCFAGKRPDSAIRIAHAAGIPLKIAAKFDKVDEDYFRNEKRLAGLHPVWLTPA